MSGKNVRRAGLLACMILGVAGVLAMTALSWAAAPPIEPDNEPPSGDTTLYIDPIPGLTTIRHRAPAWAAAPLGATLVFRQALPPGTDVEWIGAEEFERGEDYSLSECPLTQVGPISLVVRVTYGEGNVLQENRCDLEVLDVRISEIQVVPLQATVAGVEIDQEDVNRSTMEYYVSRSIAALNLVEPRNAHAFGRGQRGSPRQKSGVRGMLPMHYVTSVDRVVDFSVSVEPEGFAPWIEWRRDDMVEPNLGVVLRRSFSEIGFHEIEVGSVDNPGRIEIETYTVEIVSHTEGTDLIAEGEEVTFEAWTDPPGYERYITWLSSTKYGTADPILGRGPTFTARFDDTFGFDPNGFSGQWVGVKADNAKFGQDQKIGACCSAGQCEDNVTRSACVLEDREYQGDGSLCVNVICPPTGACCIQDSCTLGYSVVCLAAGGTYLGDETVCDPGVCDLGACCVNETCDQGTEFGCYSIGGVFGGANAPCVDMCVNALAACSPTTQSPTNGTCPVGYTSVSLGASTEDFDGHQKMCLKCINNSCLSPMDCVAKTKSKTLGGVTSWLADCPCE